MKELLLLIQIAIAIGAFASGLLCHMKPSRAIKIQQQFYAKINWKIEPINLDKELRNTKIMGALSMLLAVLIVVVLALKW